LQIEKTRAIRRLKISKLKKQSIDFTDQFTVMDSMKYITYHFESDKAIVTTNFEKYHCLVNENKFEAVG